MPKSRQRGTPREGEHHMPVADVDAHRPKLCALPVSEIATLYERRFRQ
jgi:hypothetical protein